MESYRDHIVRQSEYLPKIARLYGLEFGTIWDHPQNSTLKADRKQNPNILFPGDKLYIPEKVMRIEERPTDQRHAFIRKGKPLHLRIVLRTSDDEARATLACAVSVDGNLAQLTTDREGLLQRFIPSTASDALLVFQSPDTKEQTEIRVLIGNLDPIDQVSGQIGRLNNLGYLAGDPCKPDPELLQSAIEEFQCDLHLSVDGVCDAGTQAKLVDVHGC